MQARASWPKSSRSHADGQLNSGPPCCLGDHAPTVAAWCEGWGSVEQSQGAVMPPRIRYRLPRLQRVLPVLPLPVFVVGKDIWEWMVGDESGVAVAETLGMWAASLFAVLIIGRYFGFTLTQTTVIVHNLRRRTIPWSEIQAIWVELSGGYRTVVIYEAGGRRTRLRAPITGFLNWDRRFEEKFHTIGRWWLEHRGPEWVPVPPPGAQWGGPPTSDGSPYSPPA